MDALVHTLGTLETRTLNAVRQLTAPADATLFPDTDYLVVFEAGGPTNSHVQIHATSSDAEDLGSAAGWSIENRRRYNNVLVTPAQDSFMISVHGSAVSISTDATLSALAIKNAADAAAIAIDPAFDPATTAYTASVGNAVDEITVEPTLSDSGATFDYLDDTGSTIADADDQKDGHQVSLSVGANTIKVAVTAEDDTTTQTYTVAVTRNALATGQPAITGTAQVGQTLTAGTGTIADEDGTTQADNNDVGHAYTYQWVRVDGSSETDITNATASTYTLAAEDAGKTVKVKVSFTDDANFAEGPLTSEPYPATGRLPWQTAPPGHGGTRDHRHGPGGPGADRGQGHDSGRGRHYPADNNVSGMPTPTSGCKWTGRARRTSRAPRPAPTPWPRRTRARR